MNQILRNLKCYIFGHTTIIVNDILNKKSKDRLCIECGWNNFDESIPWTYKLYYYKNGEYHFHETKD